MAKHINQISPKFDFDGNGVPDLLDEARVAAEYLLKVQAASDHDGGVLDQIQNHKNCYR